jgi:hypothetical protein
MKKFLFAFLAIVLIVCLSGIVNAAHTTITVVENGGTSGYFSDGQAEAGSNIAKFGVPNSSYNVVTQRSAHLTLGTSLINAKNTVQADVSNSLTSNVAVKSFGSVNSEDTQATWTESAATPETGCDAGSLGTNGTTTSTGSTVFPVSERAMSNTYLMSGPDSNGTLNGLSQYSSNNVVSGNKLATTMSASAPVGIAGDSYSQSVTKSFSNGYTENYNAYNDQRAFVTSTDSKLGNPGIKSFAVDINNNGFADAFNAELPTNGTVSNSTVKVIISNTSVNQSVASNSTATN